MSIKAFHIVFISASIVLLGVFAWWCYQHSVATHNISYFIGAFGSFISAVALTIYEIKFISKIKSL